MGEEVKEQLELTKEEIDVIIAENNKFKEQFPKLKNYVDQLQQQNKIFIEKFERDGKEEFYKRLDYLYKTIEFKEVFPEEFIGSCIDEIVSTITIPEEVKQPDTQVVS